MTDLVTNPAGDKVPVSKQKRFYQLTYPQDGMPIFHEDFGNLIGIGGIVVRGKGATAIVLAPSAAADWIPDITSLTDPVDREIDVPIIRPTLEEWESIIRQTDQPLLFERDATGMTKAVHRKMRLAISGSVQQLMWTRDGCRCMYCATPMGKALMTIDHFIPLEMGGPNNDSNYLTACSRCNKLKGDQDPLKFCLNNGYDFNGLKRYLAKEIIRDQIVHLKGKV